MNERKYKCVTDKGQFLFKAASDTEALRLALWFCWRDGEKFQHIVSTTCPNYKVCAAVVTNSEFFTIHDK